LGKTLQVPISALWDWSAENHHAIVEARAVYDSREMAVAADSARKVSYARG
jgi:hypothetical protein